jgi:hypothetical protein
MVPFAPLSDRSTHDDRRPWSRRWRPLLGTVPALAIALIAVWEIAAAARAGHDVPGPDDWQAAAAELRRHHQPDELIVVAPRWLDPTLRLHLGDRIPIEMAARMDAAGYGTIWELSARGERAPEAAGLRPEQSWRFGALTLRRYRQQPARAVYDFAAHLADAEVGGAVARRPQVVLEEVGFAPRRCIRVVPRPDGTASITYRGVTLGRRLVGYVGLADVFTRRDVRAPGRLEVSVDGAEVATVTAGVDDGWVRFEAVTEPRAGAQVSFAATAVGAGARDRLICFAAEARE